VVSFFFTFGTIGLLGGAVGALKGRAQGLMAALFLSATPYFIEWGGSEYADAPVSFFILALLALLKIETRGHYHRLSSFHSLFLRCWHC
jgi:4-amino-4-deoxy-L-arabinose transferase-like glycosyltransferase